MRPTRQLHDGTDPGVRVNDTAARRDTEVCLLWCQLEDQQVPGLRTVGTHLAKMALQPFNKLFEMAAAQSIIPSHLCRRYPINLNRQSDAVETQGGIAALRSKRYTDEFARSASVASVAHL